MVIRELKQEARILRHRFSQGVKTPAEGSEGHRLFPANDSISWASPLLQDATKKLLGVVVAVASRSVYFVYNIYMAQTHRN